MFVGTSASLRGDLVALCTICMCVFLWFLRGRESRHIFVCHFFLNFVHFSSFVIQVCDSLRHNGSIRGHYDGTAWNMPFIPALYFPPLCWCSNTQEFGEKNGIWTADPTEEIPHTGGEMTEMIRFVTDMKLWTIGVLLGKHHCTRASSHSGAASWMSHRCGTGCDDGSTPA